MKTTGGWGENGARPQSEERHEPPRRERISETEGKPEQKKKKK